MKIITNYSSCNTSFGGIKPKKQTLQDVFNRLPVEYSPAKSIDKIFDIQPVMLAGTKCKNSIPLRKFWDFFETDNLAVKAFSTNKDGYADSFLKAASGVPISTSYVHDCSVMYLFDKKTKTHALYHAAPSCTKDTLEFMIKTLMPEGFTKGAIIPGDSIFYLDHRKNMENMLKLMKKLSPDALINVYNGTTKFPEIVGFRGNVYEIPNKKVKEQIQNGMINDITDYGQASFKILDLEGYNTFENINICKTTKELDDLKQAFCQAKYPKDILKMLLNKIEQRREILQKIENAKNAEELEQLEFLIPKGFKNALSYKKEEWLIEELNGITNLEDFKIFYNKVRHDLIKKNRLLNLIQDTKMKFLI